MYGIVVHCSLKNITMHEKNEDLARAAVFALAESDSNTSTDILKDIYNKLIKQPSERLEQLNTDLTK